MKVTKAIALSLMMLWPTQAMAECSLEGTVIRADVMDENRKDVHTLYIREYKTDPHYYVFDTTNQTVALASFILVSMQTRIEILGTASSCPSEGQVRYAGDVVLLIISP